MRTLRHLFSALALALLASYAGATETPLKNWEFSQDGAEDGQKLVYHRGGYTPFTVKLDGAWKQGENLVAHQIGHMAMVDLDERKPRQQVVRRPVRPLHPFLLHRPLELEQAGKIFEISDISE